MPWLMQVLDYLGIVQMRNTIADRQIIEDGRVENALAQAARVIAKL